MCQHFLDVNISRDPSPYPAKVQGSVAMRTADEIPVVCGGLIATTAVFASPQQQMEANEEFLSEQLQKAQEEEEARYFGTAFNHPMTYSGLYIL